MILKIVSQHELSQDISTIAYRNLIDTCRSIETRNMYSKALKYFMSYLRVPLGRYDKLLDLDHKIIQMNVIDYISYLRKSAVIAPRSIAVYLARN